MCFFARCSSYPLYIPAGHQTAKVHHFMTIKIPSCLSLFLALAPALPSPPLMCFKLHVWQPQPQSVFARVIHRSYMQTFYFWVVWVDLSKKKDLSVKPTKYLIITQKKVLAFVLWLQEKRKHTHHFYSTVEKCTLPCKPCNTENLICRDGSICPSFFRTSVPPTLFRLYLFKVHGGVHCCWTDILRMGSYSSTALIGTKEVTVVQCADVIHFK